MAKVKVIAGDIEESNWNFNAMFGTAIMQRYTHKHPFKGESINLNEELMSADLATD